MYRKGAEAGERSKKRKRKRKLLFFNPPFNLAVKTNVGMKFFQIVDRVFKKSALGCIFNRKTMRVSYCTTRNMARVISGHNGKLAAASTEQPAAPARTCNCTRAKRDNCPLGNECLTKNVIYSARVTGTEPLHPSNPADTPAAQPDPEPSGSAGGGSSAEERQQLQHETGQGEGSLNPPDPTTSSNNNEQEGEQEQEQYREVLYGTYTGQTSNTFKERYNGHSSDFRNSKLRNSTRLSELVWSLKDDGKKFDISWSILATARPFSPVTRRCSLCTTEKWFIMERPGTASTNARSELYSACRHMDSQLLTPQRKSKKVGLG